jgi:Malic enzyme, NAD binding domain
MSSVQSASLFIESPPLLTWYHIIHLPFLRYIFPGVGLGCIVSKAMTITDEDMYIAAVTLATCVSQSQLDMGNAYPPLSTIREVQSARPHRLLHLRLHCSLFMMSHVLSCALVTASCMAPSLITLHFSPNYSPLSSPSLYPQVSAKIAAAVAKNVFATGRSAGGGEAPKDLLAACQAAMYFPAY